ncbi:unnamed protein product, partial [Didymodactylos carnosus]
NGFQYDPTKTNVLICKLRAFVVQVGGLVSLSNVCLATIDQYFVTCRKVRIRRLSNLSTARLVILLTIILWSGHGLPLLLLYNIYPVIQQNQTTTVCSHNSTPYTLYNVYFVNLILFGLLPLSIMILFSLMVWKNMQKVGAVSSVHYRYDRQLTQMLLLQVTTIVISLIPYCAQTTYSAITMNEQKDSLHLARDTLFVSISNLLFYLIYVTSFYIYVTSSKAFRSKLVKRISKLYYKTCHKHPPQERQTTTQIPAVLVETPLY